jgi:catechol 2,3-dioxygenase-like lactoylglutathione lyase family enzyme
MPRYQGINHLALVTRDMDMTVRFWRDFLGMRLIAGLGSKEYRHYFFEISEHDCIAFFEWPGVESPPLKDHGVPVTGPRAFDHVSIGLADPSDLWSLREHFEAAGLWVSEVMDHGFIHSIYAFDPNNIAIEFSAEVKGVDLRRQPQMRDRHPARTALEGPEPVSGHWPVPQAPTPEKERLVFPGEGAVFTHDTD